MRRLLWNTSFLTMLFAGLLLTNAISANTLRAHDDTPPAPAQQLIDSALATARAEKKHVLVKFEASWCGWCKKFTAFLDAPQIKPIIAENFVVVKLIVDEADDKKALENPGASEWRAQMGGDKSGLPYYVFIDADGKKLGDSLAMPNGDNIGSPASVEEIKAFDNLLTRAAVRLTAAQRKIITDYLTAHIPS